MAKLRAPRSKISATTVREALRLRFAAPAYAYFDEVGNATGWRCNRHADGVAMSLWPSRGLELHGIEIKVSRQDWLKELADPKKADDIAKFCHRWWLAVGDESIVQPGELPGTWGLLVMRDGKLVCKVEAPLLTPEPLSLPFIAALLRRASEREDALRREAQAEGYERGKNAGPEAHQLELTVARSDLKRLQDAVDDFEKKSGIKLGDWRFGDVGDAVRKLVAPITRTDAADRVRFIAQDLENKAHHLRQQATDLEREREVIEQFQAKVGGVRGL